MKTIFAVAAVWVLVLVMPVQGASASENCVTESVSCTSLSERRSLGIADLSAADAAARQRANEAASSRLSGMAAYYSARAAWGRRADSARYQALADHYARLTWTAETMSLSRGVSGLYGR